MGPMASKGGQAGREAFYYSYIPARSWNLDLAQGPECGSQCKRSTLLSTCQNQHSSVESRATGDGNGASLGHQFWNSSQIATINWRRLEGRA